MKGAVLEPLSRSIKKAFAKQMLGPDACGRTAPRLWRRLSSPTLSSLEKKESGPRRALALLSGRHLLVEILKFIESGVVEDCFANLLLQCINPSTLFGFDYAV